MDTSEGASSATETTCAQKESSSSNPPKVEKSREVPACTTNGTTEAAVSVRNKHKPDVGVWIFINNIIVISVRILLVTVSSCCLFQSLESMDTDDAPASDDSPASTNNVNSENPTNGWQTVVPPVRKCGQVGMAQD